MAAIKRDKNSAMTHDKARQLVCAVCTNMWGNKAIRNVSVQEEGLIQQNILQVYDSRNMFYPSGICKRCIYDLSKINNGEEVQLKLPDNYLCQIGRHTRSSGDEPCMCRWCSLARLNGPAHCVNVAI